jgi:hypothetical protein|tara:strand:- start:585 stop:773 length:189 start_codon:yes stop_codon:yes gene_type:complete
MYSVNWEGWQYTGTWEGNDKDGHGEITHELKDPNGNKVSSFSFNSNYFPTFQDLKEWVAKNG